MPIPKRTAAILVAAGRGLRAGSGGPKQYRSIGGQTVIFRAMEPFCRHPKIFAVQPVLNPDDTAIFNDAVSKLRHEPPATGGATRQASVHAGLEALASQKPDVVLIHDAARPFVSAALISRAIEAASRTGAAVPAIQVTDTIKQVGETGNVEATPERARLRVAQTPQAFRFDVILDAHRRAARDGRSDFTDDAALAEWAGLTVATFEGDPANMKLTTPEDFVREEARLGAILGDIRTGTGYDVHAFGDGDHLMICGVRVPHSRGFLAHSDGDVGLHALVDAILGALADGDIGSHFPPSDSKWKGAASDRFLKYAVDRVTARGGRIANLEVTLICERPKIGPLRDTMRARIAEITALDISRVAVKATTSERQRRPRPLPLAARSLPDAQTDHRDRGILYRRPGRRRADRYPRVLRRDRPRLCHLFQRRQAGDARGQGNDACDIRRGQQGDRDRDGDRRAGESRGRSCRLHYRNCRPGRGDTGQAGRPRAFRGRRPRRPNSASRMPLRRDRPQRGAAALCRGGLAHADGAGARTAVAGQAAPRSRQPVTSARGALATAQRRQAAATAEDVITAMGLRMRHLPASRKSHRRAFRMPPQTAGTPYRTWFPSAAPASGS